MNDLVKAAAAHPWETADGANLQHRVFREDEKHTGMVAVSLNR